MLVADPLLKTHEVAEALGISVSTIKRWVDSGRLRASRTVGKHRLIPRSEAERLSQELGLGQINLGLGVRTRASDTPGVSDELRDNLTDALTQGRLDDAKRWIHTARATGIEGAALADDLIRPAMQRVGHGWSIGSLDVFQEHRATQTVGEALREAIETLPRPDPATTPLAIGATSEGDPYILPGLLVELTLREIGWNVYNLGINLPLRSLENAVVQYRPKLLFLSASYLADPERFVREYLSLFQTAARLGVALIVGGQAFSPELRSRIVFAAHGERMAHLAEFARRIHDTSGSSPVESND